MLGSLQSHELRIKQFDSSPSEQAFQVQDTNHVSFRGRGGRGSFHGQGQGRGNVQSENSSSYQRYFLCMKLIKITNNEIQGNKTHKWWKSKEN